MEIKLEVDKFSVEYAGCGSHKMTIVLDLNSVEVEDIRDVLDAAINKELLDRVERIHPS